MGSEPREDTSARRLAAFRKGGRVSSLFAKYSRREKDPLGTRLVDIGFGLNMNRAAEKAIPGRPIHIFNLQDEY